MCACEFHKFVHACSRLTVESIDVNGIPTAKLLDVDISVQSYEFDFPGGLHNKVANEGIRVTLGRSGTPGNVGKLNAQAHFLPEV